MLELKNKKTCPICKTSFTTHKKNRIFCKRRCKERSSKRPYLKHRGESCEMCGFVPVDICQLDVDHIDTNHKNNTIDNLQTLCANCHRLKTKEERIKHADKI